MQCVGRNVEGDKSVIDFTPMGKVRMSRARYWQSRAESLKAIVGLTATAAFLIGMIAGIMLTYLL